MAKISSVKVDSKIPEGPLAEKWTNYKAHQKLVNPANKRKLDIIVVGTGLAGASALSSNPSIRNSRIHRQHVVRELHDQWRRHIIPEDL